MINKKNFKEGIEVPDTKKAIQDAVEKFLLDHPVIKKDCLLLPGKDMDARDEVFFYMGDLKIELYFFGNTNCHIEVVCEELRICFGMNKAPKVKFIYTAPNGMQKQKIFS